LFFTETKHKKRGKQKAATRKEIKVEQLHKISGECFVLLSKKMQWKKKLFLKT
jgi:hypothetical protein